MELPHVRIPMKAKEGIARTASLIVPFMLILCIIFVIVLRKGQKINKKRPVWPMFKKVF